MTPNKNFKISDLRQVQRFAFRHLRLVQHLLRQVRSNHHRQADRGGTVHFLGPVQHQQPQGGLDEAALL